MMVAEAVVSMRQSSGRNNARLIVELKRWCCMAIDGGHLLNTSQTIATTCKLQKSETHLRRIEDRLNPMFSKVHSSHHKQVSVSSLRGDADTLQASIIAILVCSFSGYFETDTPGLGLVALIVEECKAGVAVEVGVSELDVVWPLSVEYRRQKGRDGSYRGFECVGP